MEILADKYDDVNLGNNNNKASIMIASSMRLMLNKAYGFNINYNQINFNLTD